MLWTARVATRRAPHCGPTRTPPSCTPATIDPPGPPRCRRRCRRSGIAGAPPARPRTGFHQPPDTRAVLVLPRPVAARPSSNPWWRARFFRFLRRRSWWPPRRTERLPAQPGAAGRVGAVHARGRVHPGTQAGSASACGCRQPRPLARLGLPERPGRNPGGQLVGARAEHVSAMVGRGQTSKATPTRRQGDRRTGIHVQRGRCNVAGATWQVQRWPTRSFRPITE